MTARARHAILRYMSTVQSTVDEVERVRESAIEQLWWLTEACPSAVLDMDVEIVEEIRTLCFRARDLIEEIEFEMEEEEES